MHKRPVVLIWCFVFSLAMAWMEAAVVVYLRRLFHPAGFVFPLAPVPVFYLIVEVIREVATLIMLAAAACLAFQTARARTAAFLFCFGVWDIAYYLWLKILLNWPAGLLDWDVLFLIPLPWVGPVLSPLLVSLLLIAAGLALLFPPGRLSFGPRTCLDLLLTAGGAALVLASYFWESDAVLARIRPETYPWWLWSAGVVLAVYAFRPRR